MIIFLSIMTLVVAVYIEYILGIKPCKLCYYQRIPFILALILSCIGLKFLNQKIILKIILLIFLSSTFLAFYHFGIENGFIPDLSICEGKKEILIDTKSIIKSFEDKIPSCKDVDFRLFGLSLANYNLIISFLLSIVTIILIKYEKNR